jgi:multidrug transporter EmrE-like cation transporter
MKTLLLILIPVVFASISELAMKKAISSFGELSLRSLLSWSFHLNIFTNPYVLFALGLYGISVLLWLIVLSRVPLSYAYPLVSISYVLVVLASKWILGEPVSLTRWVGVLLICSGVILIAKS